MEQLLKKLNEPSMILRKALLLPIPNALLTAFHLSSIKDVFECNNYHEGMHLGYMLSIRKFA